MMLKKKGDDSNGQVRLSRPAPSDSALSEYATPGTQSPSNKSAHKPQSPAVVSSPAFVNLASRELPLEAEKLSRTQVKGQQRKRQRQAQGDFWPALDVDYYPPPIERPRKRSCLDTSQVETEIDNAWPSVTPTDALDLSPVQNRWRKRIAEAMTSEWKAGERKGSKKRNQGHQSSDYGRLPPPLIEQVESNDSEHDGRLKPPGRYTASSQVQNSSPTRRCKNHTLDIDRKMAFRKEVYDAVLGQGEVNWADIGLVSVSGYQVEEEEL